MGFKNVIEDFISLTMVAMEIGERHFSFIIAKAPRWRNITLKT